MVDLLETNMQLGPLHIENQIALWVACAIPVLIVLYWISWKYYAAFESSKIVKSLQLSQTPGWWTRYAFASLKILAFILLVLAIAEPSLVYKSQIPKYEDVRIIFVVDVSNSMKYAEDIEPNRLEATKKEMLNLFGLIRGYKIGILPFAGSPNTYYCPPTTSESAYRLMTKKLRPEVASTLGTDLPRAIESLRQFIEQNEYDKSGTNIIIVLTDGGKEESLRTNRSMLFKDVQKLHSTNSNFFFVGVGKEEPTPLIMRDKHGTTLGFLPAEGGGIAKSQLDRNFLMEAANHASGEYYSFENAATLTPKLIETIQKNQGSPTYDWENKRILIQPFLFAAAAFLLWFGFIFNYRV